MRILLSRMFSLALCGAALLFASSAMAIPITYPMTGSTMSQDNSAAGGACTHATCNVAVTGNLTLDDDGLGNITLTQLNLAHPGYQVGVPGLLSVVITRNQITLGAGSVAGTGSTINSIVSFPGTSFAQIGTTNCTAIAFPCAIAGLPNGISPLTTPIPIPLGNWSFDAFGNFTATVVYTNQNGAVEHLNLVGTVPEPGTALLLATGLVGLAARRRSGLTR
jgi:hypothetical protein